MLPAIGRVEHSFFLLAEFPAPPFARRAIAYDDVDLVRPVHFDPQHAVIPVSPALGHRAPGEVIHQRFVLDADDVGEARG